MAKEIIKEILLKFKGDTKGLEKDLRNVEKAATSLQRTISGGGGSSLGNMNKTLEQFTKTSQKFGMSINKDMSKFQKAIQEVAQKDLRVLQQQTDTLFRRTEDRLKRLRNEEQRLQSMQQGGASAADIATQQRRVRRYGRVYAGTEAQFKSSADEFFDQGDLLSKNMSGGSGSRFNLGGGLKAIGGVASAVSTALAFRNQLAEQESSTRALLSGTMQQRRIAAFRGDVTEALMENRDRSMTRAQRFADAQTSRRSWGMGALAVAGIAGLAAPFTGGASLLAGAAALGGTAALGTAGMYFLGGGQEQYRETTRQREFEREKQRNMTAYYAQYLMGKAPARYELQRLTGMNDSQALAFRNAGRDNLFNEGQSGQTLMSMRGIFGNRVGGGLALDTMSLARSQGMGLETATGLMQTAALTGGQGTNAKKTLTDVYTDAFTKGIADSGLVEVFQKGLAEIVNRSPDVSDMAAMSARMTSSMESVTAGRGIGARDIMGSLAAANALDQISTQGGESGFTKMTTLSDAVGGNEQAMLFLAGRSDREIHELAKAQDPRLVNALGVEGTKRLADRFDPATTLAEKFKTTARGKDALNTAQKMLSEGKSITEVSQALGGYIETIGGTGPMSKEASADAMAQVLQNTMPQELLDQGNAANRSTDVVELENLFNNPNRTPDQEARMKDLLRKTARRDIREGNDLSYYSKFGVLGAEVMNEDLVSKGPESTRAGVLTQAQMKGASAEDIEANQVEIRSLKAAAAGTAAAVGPNSTINGSIDNLVTALRAFASAVQNENSNSASSTATGSR